MPTLEDDLVFIDFDNIHLDLDNPRHEELETQEEVINHLCKNEQILAMAKHIVKNGLNPLEVFALIQTGQDTYISGEGNRRTCALKLLNDPELSPKGQRSSFEKLHSEWKKIDRIPAIVFNTKKNAEIWIELTHGGQQSGAGRKRWDPVQYARFKGDGSNKLAKSVLEYSLENNFLTKEQSYRKITTISRYFSNPVFRNIIGIDNSDSENITRNRTKEDFDALIKKFIDDLLSNTVGSRKNKKDIEKYANDLIAETGISDIKRQKVIS